MRLKEGKKILNLKEVVDFSLSESSQNGIYVDSCLTYENESSMKKEDTKWQKRRDIWWQMLFLNTLHFPRQLELTILTLKRKTLANALPVRPSMWTLGNASMGALEATDFIFMRKGYFRHLSDRGRELCVYKILEFRIVIALMSAFDFQSSWVVPTIVLIRFVACDQKGANSTRDHEG
ncbi:unnamed protein product [Lactuca saligna]|uniref:Uncharacterized protein n=1 Tax=Lactuca saligna TaxID=75948 RepID=A0AA36EH71_LACSI|nr:unnamed protein product [Lactuca saligna]